MKKLKAFFYLCVAQPWIPLLIVVALAAFIVFGKISGCRVGNWSKKVEQTKENIQNSAVNAAVSEATANAQERAVNKQEGIVNEKERNANAVGDNYNAAFNRRVDTFSNSATEARRNYCSDAAADDPLCRDYRRER